MLRRKIKQIQGMESRERHSYIRRSRKASPRRSHLSSLVWGDGANHEAAGKSVPDEGGHVVRLGRVRGLEPGDVGIRVGRRRWELGQEPQRLASRATARPWILF